MKSRLHMSLGAAALIVAMVGTTQAAHAPDRSGCRSSGAILTAASAAAPATLVAEDNAAVPASVGSDGVTPAPGISDAPAATALNIYSEIGADKLSPSVADATPRVYVPNHSSNTVSVIDVATQKIVQTIRVGRGPEHIIPSWDLKTLWVANNANQTTQGSMTPIDAATGKAGPSVPVNDPYNMYFMPDGSAAIIVAEAYHRLELRDPQTMALKSTIETPDCKGINHGDYAADYSFMVFTCEFSGKLMKVDIKNGVVLDQLSLSKLGSMPQDVRLTPDGKTFFVTDMWNDGVYFIDAGSFKENGFVHTGPGAHGLTTSRDGTKIYVSNRGSNRMPDRAGKPGSVAVLDFASKQVERTWLIPGGGSPDMGNVTADGKQLWLSGRFDGQVYVLDTDSGAVTKINVGIEPHGLTVWPQPGRFSLGHTGNMR